MLDLERLISDRQDQLRGRPRDWIDGLFDWSRRQDWVVNLTYVGTLFFILLIAWFLASTPASAQSAPKHYLSAASNNSTLVLGRPSVVKMLHAVNTNAAINYLKLYDKVTAPVCGTDVPVFTSAIPASATGGAPISPDIGDGLLFYKGVGFCITAGIADNDNTNATTGVTLDLGISAR